jgi:predicted phosphoribosyltransferase
MFFTLNSSSYLKVEAMTEIISDTKMRNKVKVYKNRRHAGTVLSKHLEEFRDSNAIVLAVPACGVPVAHEISYNLNLPMDLVITRKLHIPWNPEAGFGAVTWSGEVMINQSLLQELRLSDDQILHIIEEEKEAIERRMKLFRGDTPLPVLDGRQVILVDDGLASGFTMMATAKVLLKKELRQLIVAIPTGSPDAISRVQPYTDIIICPNIRHSYFFAVASAYEHWYDLSDEDVLELLEK